MPGGRIPQRAHVAELERRRVLPLDVRHPAVVDPELVDLQRVDRLPRLRPAFLLDGNPVLGFLLQMLAVDVDLGAREAEVGDDPGAQELSPLHARFELRNEGDRGIRMGLLDDGELLERETEADRMETEAAKPDGVSLQPRVELALHAPACYSTVSGAMRLAALDGQPAGQLLISSGGGSRGRDCEVREK